MGVEQESSATEKAVELLREGAQLNQEGKHREAIRRYEQVLEFAPEEATAYYALATAYESMGEMEQALDYMEQAADLAPDNARILRNLGRLQCFNDQGEDCVRTLEEAVELDPDHSLGHYWLGLAYQSTANEDMQRALEQYREAARIEPSLGSAHLALGRLYGRQPETEVLALEAFKLALQIAREKEDADLEAKAHAELAALYDAQGRYDECVDEWAQVLAEQPGNPTAHRRLGVCYAMRKQAGDLALAVQEMERALELEFGHMDTYYYTLGQYHAAEGEDAEAKWAWEQFLRFSENEELNAQVREWIAELEP
jgi:tetratricopeptide (TPR) repeat protein